MEADLSLTASLIEAEQVCMLRCMADTLPRRAPCFHLHSARFLNDLCRMPLSPGTEGLGGPRHLQLNQAVLLLARVPCRLISMPEGQACTQSYPWGAAVLLGAGHCLQISGASAGAGSLSTTEAEGPPKYNSRWGQPTTYPAEWLPIMCVCVSTCVALRTRRLQAEALSHLWLQGGKPNASETEWEEKFPYNVLPSY